MSSEPVKAALQVKETRSLKEASEWLLRLNSDPSDDDVADWLRWCESDAQNLQAFEQINADWRDVISLRQDAAFSARELGDVREEANKPASARPWVWALAAIVACIAIALGFFGLETFRDRSIDAQHIIAGTENETTALPDGSLVTLRAQAAVKVRFARSARWLEVAQDGEAYFKVKHDPARPFIVRAGEITIQAIGTAFDVKHDADRIRVVVAEGSVKISSRTAHWTFEAGQQFEYSQAANRVNLARIDVEHALRWREGEFAYEKVALADVIRDVNRYYAGRIVIRDPRVSEMSYTGTVFVSALDDWLEALASKYPVRVVTGPDGQVALESAGRR